MRIPYTHGNALTIPDPRPALDRVVHSKQFEYTIIALILANGVLIGLETSGAMVDAYGDWMNLGMDIILGAFIAEAALKILAVAPRVDRYFRDGWNLFDFAVIVFSLVPAVGQFATIARTARLLRVVRLISAMPELRLIVATLVRSLPSMVNIVALMALVVYIYAIVGHQLFGEHDPARWGNLGVATLTLFQVITLEEWAIIMNTAREVQSLAWIYFVSYVVIATFVVVNLFIAVVINNLDEAKESRLREIESPQSRDQLLQELRAARNALQRLENRLKRDQGLSTGPREDRE